MGADGMSLVHVCSLPRAALADPHSPCIRRQLLTGFLVCNSMLEFHLDVLKTSATP